MKIALTQLAVSPDKTENLLQVQRCVRDAANQGAELVVFGEATLCPFGRQLRAAAEPLDGPWAQAVGAVAHETGTTVVVGTFTPTTNQRVRNTILVTGGPETHYDKIHLFDALGYCESALIEPGDKAITFNLHGHTIGLATCYDVRFPHLFTSLANHGADLILLPAAWAPGENKLHQWRTLVSARAMDATCFVVAVDQAVPENPYTEAPSGIGHSMAIDPRGNVLLELGATPELAVIDIDLSQVPKVRAELPVLAHTRPLPDANPTPESGQVAPSIPTR